MAFDFPPWAIKAVDKIRRGFLWRGRKDAKGGHCLVAWVKVCQPLELGGLGISDLKSLGWALRMRWVWLQKTEPHRPWAALPLHVLEQVRAFFSVAVSSIVGDGANTLFWSDRWLHGKCIFSVIPKRRVKRRTVRDALTNQAWTSDIQGALTVGVFAEYFQLWDLLMDFQLQQEVEDRHVWRLSSNGQYSAKSAYDGFFLDHGKESGNHGHRPNVASLCGWSRTTSVGRLIAWHVVGCLIRNPVLFVTKKTRLLTISLSIMCSQENFGSICSNRSVFIPCPLSLSSCPSMLGGRKFAVAPLMG
jgi:hypothetical protein